MFFAAMMISAALVSCEKSDGPEGPVGELTGEWVFTDIDLTVEGGGDRQSEIIYIYGELENILTTLLIGEDHIFLATPTGDLRSDYIINEEGKMALDRSFEGVFMSPLTIGLNDTKLVLSEDLADFANESWGLSGSEAFTKLHVVYKFDRVGDYDGNYTPDEGGDSTEEPEPQPTLEEKVVGEWACKPIYVYSGVDESLRWEFENKYLLSEITDFSRLRLNSDFSGEIGGEVPTIWSIVGGRLCMDAGYGAYEAEMEITGSEAGAFLNVEFGIEMTAFMNALYKFYEDKSLDTNAIPDVLENPMTICDYTYVGE